MTTRTTLLTTSLLLAAAALCALALASTGAAASETKGGHHHGGHANGTTKAEGPNSAGDGSPGGDDHARTDKALKNKLLKASEGVQYPGSESASTWQFVSYPDEKELPDPDRFQQISSCPVTEGGGTSRLDFDETMNRLTKIEPWMDDGQVKSAKGFKKIEQIMKREYDERAVYQCETGQYGQVYIYFVGVNEDVGISGLLTVSTET